MNRIPFRGIPYFIADLRALPGVNLGTFLALSIISLPV